MLHEPAAPQGKDYAPEYKTRLGVVLFFVYAAVYGGFLAINLIWPKSMAKATPVFGLNVAVVYGFALIIFALLLALVYTHLCTRKEKEHRAADEAANGKGGEA
jgi:TRAP-type C4-dicarboxylate transport system permease small subunit